MNEYENYTDEMKAIWKRGYKTGMVEGAFLGFLILGMLAYYG